MRITHVLDENKSDRRGCAGFSGLFCFIGSDAVYISSGLHPTAWYEDGSVM